MIRLDDSIEERANTAGRVAPHSEVRIVDPINGQSLPRGIAGEIWTRGFGLMRGYWNDHSKYTMYGVRKYAHVVYMYI